MINLWEKVYKNKHKKQKNTQIFRLGNKNNYVTYVVDIYAYVTEMDEDLYGDGFDVDVYSVIVKDIDENPYD